MPPPRALTCFICGRGYGTASLEIHIKQCEKLFLEQEALKPKSERRKLPQRPEVMAAAGATPSSASGASKMNAKEMHAYNDAAFNAYNEQALIKCENCGRTFLPESLKRHHNACTPEHPARPVNGHVQMGQSGPFVPENMRPSTSSTIQTRLEQSRKYPANHATKTAAPPAEKPWKTKKATTRKPAPTYDFVEKSTSQDGAMSNSSSASSVVRDQLTAAKALDAHHSSPPNSAGSFDPLDVLRLMVTDLRLRNFSKKRILEAVEDAFK